MASMPLKFDLFQYNSECSYLDTYKKIYNLKNLLCQSNLKKYLSRILIGHGFIFKYCKSLSSIKLKEYNRSTVATNASELDLVVANETSNFEYDDNEWDVGIGNLIIDLDADIEKTQDEKLNLKIGMASTPTTSLNHQLQTVENLSSSIESHSSGCQLSTSQASNTVLSTVTSSINKQSHSLNNTNNSLELTISNCKINSTSSVSGTSLCNKMAVEHSSTVDKGLKMKIKRTKPGTKSSEVKHEIVKSNEANGSSSNQDSQISISTSLSSLSVTTNSQLVHTTVEIPCSSLPNKSKPFNLPTSVSSSTISTIFNTSKRTSSNHRREKGRDKHEKMQNNHTPVVSKIELNGSLKPVQNNIQNVSSIEELSNPLPNLNITSANISSASDQNISSITNTNSPCTGPILSSPITNFGNNVDQCLGLAANTSQIQIQGSQLCSKTIFKVNQNNICLNEVSNNTPIYSSNRTSTSTINVEESKCSASTGNIHFTDIDDTLDTAIDSPPAKKSKCFTEIELKVHF
jgi:hypothetical protein